VPTNAHALGGFRHHVTDLWRRTLRRRSQKDGITWARMTQLVDAFLPKPIILYPWPSDRFAVTPKVGAVCGKAARTVLCGRQRHETRVPTATREDIAYWPISEVATLFIEIRSMWHSRVDLLTLSFSHFDPQQ
jgi:hypothetical protein